MTTTNLAMTLPTVGASSDTWGDTLNADLNLIDAYLAPGQLKGTATNDSAAAGKEGEFTEATVAVGSAVSLVTATAKTVTSISLTAGDWEVTGTVWFTGGATTQVLWLASAIGTTTNVLPATGGKTDRNQLVLSNATLFASLDCGMPVGPTRISVSGTTTVYLVGAASFATSTCSAYGHIRARRAR